MDKIDIKEIVAIVICIVVVIGVSLYFAGFLDNDEEDTVYGDDITDIHNNDSPAEESSSGSLKIKIEYNGTFTAGYGSANKNDDFTSSGSREIDLGNSTYVDVGAKKSDDSSGLLKLTILKGDKVVSEKTTTDPYGEVIIHYSIN
ncbi:MAG: hypothetical protein FWH29_00210 [Methanobrevibacter sp.]|nr:hypothetical protein [Methanobrevibacter sp.]